MIKYIFKRAFSPSLKNIFIFLYYVFFEAFIFLCLNLLYQKTIIADAIVLNEAGIIVSVLAFILLALFLIKFLSEEREKERNLGFYSVNNFPTTSYNKYMMIYGSNGIIAVIGTIFGLLIAILTLALVNISISGSISLDLRLLYFLLPLFIPTFIGFIISLFRTLLKSFSINAEIFYNFPYLLAIVCIFFYIFAEKNLIVNFLFVITLPFVGAYAVYELYNLFKYLIKRRKESVSYYNSKFGREFVTRKLIVSLMIGMMIMFLLLIWVSSTKKSRENYYNFYNYSYVIEEPQNDNEVRNYLSGSMKYQYISLSNSITGKMFDSTLCFYITDLSSINDFYNFEIKEENSTLSTDNGIFLSIYYKDKYSLSLGETVPVIIEGETHYFTIEAFIEDDVPLIAFINNIPDFNYNKYDKILLKSSVVSDIEDDISTNLGISASTRSSAFQNIDNQYDMNYAFSIILSLTFFVILLLFYVERRREFYRKNEKTFSIFSSIPTYKKYYNRIVYGENEKAFLSSYIVFIVLIFMFAPFINKVDELITIIDIKSVSLTQYITYMLVILLVYNIMFFIEYALYRHKEKHYQDVNDEKQ